MRASAWAKARAMHSREHFEELLSSYVEQSVRLTKRELANLK
jgi:hypothetical protein